MEKVLYELNRLKQQEIAFIVEGKKDKKALQKFGIKNIHILNKKPIFAVVEDILEKEKECVILTDLDKEGRRLYAKLRKELNRFGIKTHDKIRTLLFKKTKLRQVEGLASYTEHPAKQVP